MCATGLFDKSSGDLLASLAASFFG